MKEFLHRCSTDDFTDSLVSLSIGLAKKKNLWQRFQPDPDNETSYARQKEELRLFRVENTRWDRPDNRGFRWVVNYKKLLEYRVLRFMCRMEKTADNKASKYFIFEPSGEHFETYVSKVVAQFLLFLREGVLSASTEEKRQELVGDVVKYFMSSGLLSDSYEDPVKIYDALNSPKAGHCRHMATKFKNILRANSLEVPKFDKTQQTVLYEVQYKHKAVRILLRELFGSNVADDIVDRIYGLFAYVACSFSKRNISNDGTFDIYGILREEVPKLVTAMYVGSEAAIGHSGTPASEEVLEAMGILELSPHFTIPGMLRNKALIETLKPYKDAQIGGKYIFTPEIRRVLNEEHGEPDLEEPDLEDIEAKIVAGYGIRLADLHPEKILCHGSFGYLIQYVHAHTRCRLVVKYEWYAIDRVGQDFLHAEQSRSMIDQDSSVATLKGILVPTENGDDGEERAVTKESRDGQENKLYIKLGTILAYSEGCDYAAFYSNPETDQPRTGESVSASDPADALVPDGGTSGHDGQPESSSQDVSMDDLGATADPDEPQESSAMLGIIPDSEQPNRSNGTATNVAEETTDGDEQSKMVENSNRVSMNDKEETTHTQGQENSNGKAETTDILTTTKNFSFRATGNFDGATASHTQYGMSLTAENFSIQLTVQDRKKDPPRFDSSKIPQEDGEDARLWDRNAGVTKIGKVVSRDEQDKIANQSAPKKVQVFTAPGYIAGNSTLPPNGSMEPEAGGEDATLFTVVTCQPGALEVAYGRASEGPQEENDFNPDTAQRFFLDPGCMFRVPPGNTYRVHNHSSTTDAFLTWTIIRPLQHPPAHMVSSSDGRTGDALSSPRKKRKIQS